jgi:hypothetical protein
VCAVAGRSAVRLSRPHRLLRRVPRVPQLHAHVVFIEARLRVAAVRKLLPHSSAGVWARVPTSRWATGPAWLLLKTQQNADDGVETL